MYVVDLDIIKNTIKLKITSNTYFYRSMDDYALNEAGIDNRRKYKYY